MGSESSTLADCDSNEYLCKFTGSSKVERSDKFWDEFLQFSFEQPELREDSKTIEDSIQELCKKLVSHNHVTGNFTTLVGVFIFHTQNLFTNLQMQDSHEACKVPENSLMIIRLATKYMVDNLPEQELTRQFNTLPTCEGTRTIFEEFLLNVVGILSKLTVKSSTYVLHLEAVYTLITLLSVQMQEMRPTTSSIIHLSIMNSKCSELAPKLMRQLFHNYINNHLLPSEENNSGIIGKTLSTVWSIFGGGDVIDPDLLRPLANHSLLLILVLTNQLTKDTNPYRDAIFCCAGDRQTTTVNNDDSKSEKTEDQQHFFNFSRLYRSICRDIGKDQCILLLYFMVHRNQHFMENLLQRDDLGNLVLPLLEVLYHADEKHSHLTYMTLIVLLILSQEEVFNFQMHRTILPNVPWYKDRSLNDISLGGLITLVIMRLMQQNMIKMRDKYLHTNCLATLANMSAHFHQLPSCVCDRFFSVFIHLLKKYTRLSKNISLDIELESTNEFADANVLEEILRMFLEILNSCIMTSLKENPNIIYALLHEKETFDELEKHPKFQDILFNINLVLIYFNQRIECRPDETLSVEKVHEVIRKEIINVPHDHFKKFPELRFKYMEEDEPEEFFVPYVWSIVYKSSCLFWDLNRIALFQLAELKKS